MHLTKFGKQLNKEEAYLKTCGINIADDVKTQFYVEQMIDSGIFSKEDIIAWESDLQDKDWGDAVLYFEERMEDEDKYTEVLGGAEKRTRFESAQTAQERHGVQEEQREQEISNNERMQAYITSTTWTIDGARWTHGGARKCVQNFTNRGTRSCT